MRFPFCTDFHVQLQLKRLITAHHHNQIKPHHNKRSSTWQKNSKLEAQTTPTCSQVQPNNHACQKSVATSFYLSEKNLSPRRRKSTEPKKRVMPSVSTIPHRIVAMVTSTHSAITIWHRFCNPKLMTEQRFHHQPCCCQHSSVSNLVCERETSPECSTAEPEPDKRP